MGNSSRTVDGNNNKPLSREVDDSTCKTCNGRKYTLVASRKMNQTSVVYGREVCQACAEDERIPVAETYSQAPHSKKKRLSGTGYLRNKKRRRKEDI